jgi:phosphoribosylformylglycinamidine synthase
LYNENTKGAIYPTPVVGMVGLVHDTDHITTQEFKAEGDAIFLLGETKAEIGGSEFQYAVHGITEGRPPELDLAVEKKLQQTVLGAIQEGLVASAHDLSEGGLAAALAEAGFGRGLGADVTFETNLRPDLALFSESQSRILLTAKPEAADRLAAFVGAAGVSLQRLGTVSGDRLKVSSGGHDAIDASIEELRDEWKQAIPSRMNGKTA